MKRSLVTKILLTIFFLFLLSLIYSKISKKNEAVKKEPILNNEDNYNSNIIKDVNYLSKDERGNEYILDAAEGQIDLSNNKIIFLTNVKAIINLNDSRNISISSDFGKYNIDNYDTIFSKKIGRASCRERV